MDEVGDHPAHQVFSALRGNSSEAGGIYVDHPSVGVDAHGVGAVLQQLPESLFDRIER